MDTVRDDILKNYTKNIISVSKVFIPGAVEIEKLIIQLSDELQNKVPIPMILTCPSCSGRHIDEGEFAYKAHHTHACQHCGMCWRPSVSPTCGVQFLPGFKN